jgi:outer membrane protein insertion porin family
MAHSNSSFDANSIKSRIKSKEGGFFNQAEFDNDLKILSQDFDRIEPVIEFVGGKIFITLKIWPKPSIRQICWNGNHKICTEDLAKELDVTACTVFDRLAFNKAFHKLKTYYVTHGFFEAELNYTVTVDACTNEVDIVINVKEGRAGHIEKIVFCNFTQEETDELAEMFVTKPYNIFTSWLNGEGTYREEAIRQDEYLVLNYLQDKGFADARVHIEIREAKADCIVVAVKADRGCQYSIGNICVKGNSLFTTDEVMTRIRLCPGECYSPDAIRAAALRVTNLYGRFGYIDTYVDFVPKLVCNQYVYDLEFTIEEGEQFRVGLIKVMGNTCTQTNVILHETLLVPGEIFNLEKMQITEERLINIGYFKSVNVYTVKSDANNGLGGNYRDVLIEVQETTTGQFGASFGFSTVEEIFGTLYLTERNFNYKGLGSLFSRGFSALRGGGEYFNISLTLGQKSRSYVLSWSKPYFMDTKWTVGFDIESATNRYIARDYTINSVGITPRASYQLNPFVKMIFHYRLKNTHIDVDTSDVRHDVEEAYDDWVANPTDKNLHKLADQEEHYRQLKHDVKLSGLISAIGAAWVYDSTNHPMKPSRGFKSRFEGECAGLWGKHTFLSFGYLNAYYFQLPNIDSRGVWKLRGDMRFIQPVGGTTHNTIPIDERYFLGGPYTIRGYRPFRVGPSYEAGDPEGGISLQLASIEYSRALNKTVELFAFIDSGHLSDHVWNFGYMHTSIGCGVRLGLLPGSPPFVFGYGFPINPRNRHEVRRFFFELGGQF